MTDDAVGGLQSAARRLAGRLAPAVARDCVDTLGYVPVCVDGTGIEVQGRQFEQAAKGCNGERQYWLHSVFAGGAWVSGRLRPGGSDVGGGWREQLEADVAPLLLLTLQYTMLPPGLAAARDRAARAGLAGRGLPPAHPCEQPAAAPAGRGAPARRRSGPAGRRKARIPSRKRYPVPRCPSLRHGFRQSAAPEEGNSLVRPAPRSLSGDLAGLYWRTTQDRHVSHCVKRP